MFEKENQTFKVLRILEFNSDRKRMSVIIKTNDGKIVLLCKGADAVVEKLLIKGNKELKATKKAIDNWAETGLRTLLLAKKVISPEVYKKWDDTYVKLD